LLVTLMRALADFDGSARLRAVSVTPAGVGRTCGAVRSPLGSTVPQAAPEHPGPEVLQLTARSGLPEPVMLARNCWVAPSSTLAVAGETLTVKSLLTVSAAPALFVGSAALAAVIASVAGEGRSCGAV
jgi:hypothetical protein